MKNPEPKVGDVWQNNDGKSRLLVAKITDTHVLGHSPNATRPRRVQIDALKKTGRWGWTRISTKEDEP